MKRVTVPFFISHRGCPHTCVFCDQYAISGTDGVLPTSPQILAKIDLWRSTSGKRPLEVAFFGGTFTALPIAEQEKLLLPLQKLLGSGLLDSIRISTRPDCIDAGHAAWLTERGVTVIELGVQSMDDDVLAASGRGHSAAASLNAIRCIKDSGLKVGAQIMPGLPGDSPVTSLRSVEQVIAAGVDFIRIYPTVVLRGTELARRYSAGNYTPLSLERGTALCKVMLQCAMRSRVPVIRIGLQADEGINADTVLSGCWHPALGHLVRSQLYQDLIDCHVPPGMSVKVYCHPTRFSDVVGMKSCNLKRQAGRGVLMTVAPDAGLLQDEVKVQHEESSLNFSIINDINYSIHEV